MQCAYVRSDFVPAAGCRDRFGNLCLTLWVLEQLLPSYLVGNIELVGLRKFHIIKFLAFAKPLDSISVEGNIRQ